MSKKASNRKSIRLPHYDYASAGAYFVTIITLDRKPLFGRTQNEIVRLNRYGGIAQDRWEQIPIHFPFVRLDAFVVMPNHVHGILFFEESDLPVGAQHAAPLRQDRMRVQPGSLGAIVRSYKSAVTRAINQIRNSTGQKLWQRNYYEHVIRDEPDLDEIRHYIGNNPTTWTNDSEFLG